jgi:ATP-dependent DNA helicase RecG
MNNGLDWKARLSDNKDRVTEHLIAFANHPNGGYLVYGIDDAGGKPMGVNAEQAEEIIGRLTNLGRDAVEPPLILDHAILDYDNVPLLFVFICDMRTSRPTVGGKALKRPGFAPVEQRARRRARKSDH